MEAAKASKRPRRDVPQRRLRATGVGTHQPAACQRRHSRCKSPRGLLLASSLFLRLTAPLAPTSLNKQRIGGWGSGQRRLSRAATTWGHCKRTSPFSTDAPVFWKMVGWQGEVLLSGASPSATLIAPKPTSAACSNKQSCRVHKRMKSLPRADPLTDVSRRRQHTQRPAESAVTGSTPQNFAVISRQQQVAPSYGCDLPCLSGAVLRRNTSFLRWAVTQPCFQSRSGLPQRIPADGTCENAG